MLRHLVLLMLAIPAAVSCRNSTAPSDALQVSLVSSAEVIRPGASIVILVTATNRGPTPLAIEGNPCPDRFVVLDPADEIVGPPLRYCLAYSVQLTLQPGEHWTFQYTWDGTGRQANVDDPPPTLPPGDYRLIGSAFGSGVQARSAPVPIRVE